MTIQTLTDNTVWRIIKQSSILLAKTLQHVQTNYTLANVCWQFLIAHRRMLLTEGQNLHSSYAFDRMQLDCIYSYKASNSKCYPALAALLITELPKLCSWRAGLPKEHLLLDIMHPKPTQPFTELSAGEWHTCK